VTTCLNLNALATFSYVLSAKEKNDSYFGTMQIGDVLRERFRKARGRLLLIRKKVRSREQLSYPCLFLRFEPVRARGRRAPFITTPCNHPKITLTEVHSCCHGRHIGILLRQFDSAAVQRVLSADRRDAVYCLSDAFEMRWTVLMRMRSFDVEQQLLNCKLVFSSAKFIIFFSVSIYVFTTRSNFLLKSRDVS